MDKTSKQQKLFNKTKNTILKLSKFVISRALYFVLGICVAVAISAVYAAVVTWPAPQVSPSNPLTSELWNTFAENLDDLNIRVNNFVDTDTHGTCWISGYNNCELILVSVLSGLQVNCPSNKFVRGGYNSGGDYMICCDIVFSCN